MDAVDVPKLKSDLKVLGDRWRRNWVFQGHAVQGLVEPMG